MGYPPAVRKESTLQSLRAELIAVKGPVLGPRARGPCLGPNYFQ